MGNIWNILYLLLASSPTFSWPICISRIRDTSQSKFSDSHCLCSVVYICDAYNVREENNKKKKIQLFLLQFSNGFSALWACEIELKTTMGDGKKYVKCLKHFCIYIYIFFRL
jgi:hypothetical protein